MHFIVPCLCMRSVSLYVCVCVCVCNGVSGQPPIKMLSVTLVQRPHVLALMAVKGLLLGGAVAGTCVLSPLFVLLICLFAHAEDYVCISLFVCLFVCSRRIRNPSPAYCHVVSHMMQQVMPSFRDPVTKELYQNLCREQKV